MINIKNLVINFKFQKIVSEVYYYHTGFSGYIITKVYMSFKN